MFKLKNTYREIYTAHPRFIMRNPLFPIREFYNWCASSGADGTETRNIQRAALKAFYSQPIVQEALYVSSPDLHEQLKLWLTDSIDKAKTRDKIELSLVKYFSRMCSRCTPYGLLASCSTGVLSEKTTINLADITKVERHGRLDMDYVCQLMSYLLKQKDITGQLLFYPNTSLYETGHFIRYIEHRFLESTGRTYHLVQIEASEYLEKVLTAARKGLKPGALAELLVDEEISFEEAIEFIYEMISSQVLVSELEANVTGTEYFFVLLEKLKKLEHTEQVVAQLELVARDFDAIQHAGGEPVNHLYQDIAEHLKPLEVPIMLRTLIQVDSYRPTEAAEVHKRIANEILRGASLLLLMNPEARVGDPFGDFKNNFNNRYEHQRVPAAWKNRPCSMICPSITPAVVANNNNLRIQKYSNGRCMKMRSSTTKLK
jgi:lantibiotic biosynthesis protein